MPQKKYLVTLEDKEREQLEQLLHSGTHATRKVTRARILLTLLLDSRVLCSRVVREAQVIFKAIEK